VLQVGFCRSELDVVFYAPSRLDTNKCRKGIPSTAPPQKLSRPATHSSHKIVLISVCWKNTGCRISAKGREVASCLHVQIDLYIYNRESNCRRQPLHGYLSQLPQLLILQSEG
jgi:hypothetical protein